MRIKSINLINLEMVAGDYPSDSGVSIGAGSDELNVILIVKEVGPANKTITFYAPISETGYQDESDVDQFFVRFATYVKGVICAIENSGGDVCKIAYTYIDKRCVEEEL